MKNITILLSFLILCFTAVAQTSPSTAANTTDPLVLKESVHDFGKIPQGKPVYYYFEITNTGTEPLKLDDVHASCGCTTPEWDRKPIPAGQSTKIRIGYNAAADGYFEKFINITYHTSQSKQIKILGTVWKAPNGSAPANESIQLLKHLN